ncbi:MAG: aspartate/glutamate racemase family protein [Candidatus Saccharimonas sp.]
MRIGVFDSGKGGRLVADRLAALLPGNEWVVVSDLEHVPYGERTGDEIISLTDQAIAPLLAACPMIVIACNTATTAAIHTLRTRHPAIKFVGVEPMIKPAALASQSAHITLLATPFTLASERYTDLKTTYGEATVIDEPNTAGWPTLIDQGNTKKINLSAVQSSIQNGSDTIVLACTHYLDLIPMLSRQFPAVSILEPSEALARQIQRLSA